MNLRERFEELVTLPEGEFNYWKLYAEFAEVEHDKLKKDMVELLEALKWYESSLINVNRRGDLGEVARASLAKDMGERATEIIKRMEARE